jgi:hypothetical protein
MLMSVLAEVIFSWEETLSFESSGQSGFLVSFALDNWFCFFASWMSVAVGGLAITVCKLVLRHIYAGHQQNPPLRKLAFLAVASGSIYILTSLLVRPSSVVPATDLLLDGFGASATLLLAIFGFGSGPVIQPPSDSLYGSSNIRQPRITRLPSAKKLEHVFHIFLESADGLAWPFSSDFCEQRFCQDIKPEYNTAEHMTPFFASLVNDPNTYFTPHFKTKCVWTRFPVSIIRLTMGAFQCSIHNKVSFWKHVWAASSIQELRHWRSECRYTFALPSETASSTGSPLPDGILYCMSRLLC